MSVNPTDQLGPVDYLVIEFQRGARHFTDEMANELAVLAETELIRILDIVVLDKHDDGEIEAFELDDLEELDAFRAIGAEMAEFLAADDVMNLAAAMEPGTTAGVVIWENTWAAPFVSAVRHSGGQVVANGRIPVQAILDSLDA